MISRAPTVVAISSSSFTRADHSSRLSRPLRISSAVFFAAGDFSEAHPVSDLRSHQLGSPLVRGLTSPALVVEPDGTQFEEGASVSADCHCPPRSWPPPSNNTK